MATIDRRPDWVADAVFYQIFPDRFCNGDPSNDPPGTGPWGTLPTRDSFAGGDLEGIRRRLPYLTDLGITAIYLTPIFEAGTNHRYDTHDYLRVDPALGDATLLRTLVDEAHEHGIRVVLDGVFNHCGDGFWAFRDLEERGPSSAYRSWFFPSSFPIRRDPPTYQTCGGAPYLPKLNTADPALRRHLLGVAVSWIETADIDGWRLDVPWKVPLDFWQELRRAVKASKPEAYLVGEIWRDPRPWLGVFDGVMNYRLRDHLLDFCVRDHMDAEDLVYELTDLLRNTAASTPSMLNLLGSHDTPRLLTLCGGDERRAILAMTALFTLPGAPMVYYGDEVGLEGGTDPDCRRCMVWDEARWNNAIVRACRTLIGIRRGSQALRRGAWDPLLAFNGVLAYRRHYASEEVVVVLNPRERRRDLAIPLGHCSARRWRDLLSGDEYEAVDGTLKIGDLETAAASILSPIGLP